MAYIQNLHTDSSDGVLNTCTAVLYCMSKTRCMYQTSPCSVVSTTQKKVRLSLSLMFSGVLVCVVLLYLYHSTTAVRGNKSFTIVKRQKMKWPSTQVLLKAVQESGHIPLYRVVPDKHASKRLINTNTNPHPFNSTCNGAGLSS